MSENSTRHLSTSLGPKSPVGTYRAADPQVILIHNHLQLLEKHVRAEVTYDTRESRNLVLKLNLEDA